MAKLVLAMVVAAVLVVSVHAYDPSPINDYCVADLTNQLGVTFNGLLCKAPANVTTADFTFTGFRATPPTNNSLGFGLIPGFASVNYPGLNTLGLSLAKIAYAQNGLVPPHTHPRATEVITVLSGQVNVGFVDTSGNLFAVTLQQNDFFVFPLGLVHYELALVPSVTLSVLNSQNPGIQLIPSSLFGSTPLISSQVLQEAFGINASTVAAIEKGFAPS